jgi:galactonate dehydratase
MRNALLARRARLLAFAAPQAVTSAGTNAQLEISALRTYPLKEPVSQRSYTILKLETRGGSVGYGECAGVTAQDLARVSAAVRGREVTQFETVRHQLKNAPAGLMAALNMAMLDVAGRSMNTPVYQVLGGPTRFKCRALAPLEGASDTELVASVRRAREAGFKAFTVPAPPVKWRNQGQAFMLAARKRLDALREAAGAGTDFVLDGGGSLLPADAAGLAQTFERYHLLWLDEPCAVSSLGAVRKIAAENVTPLGFGRFIHQPAPFQDLLREDAIDILRPDISLNGISQVRQMAAIAETYYVAVAPYHNGGPVATAAALQLAASLPNFFIQQIPLPQAEQDRKMRAAVAAGAEVVKDGFAQLPVGPGLGITVNEKALEEYKERAA